ncbi:YopX family protein [Bacillus subtilis]|uniref:YopX family protein n=1 Tax=Bacillus subtilis TaxID=1423 RepID=UPI00240E9210|nr:YopX family protein [Bacillus subtilis]WEY89745.1 YopX family protein [Bacillus subtilis]WEZ21294.1 YopX family protein [Bacillus subtilis]
MDIIKIRYTFRHKGSGYIEMKWYSIGQLEERTAAKLSPVFSDEYELISRHLYTGLMDKYGREIYEGDILRVWEEDEHVPNHDSGGGIIDFDIIEGFSQLGVVDFKGSWFTYETKKHQKGREVNIFAPLDFTNNFEIIGNIYENPKLLEAAE